MKIDKDKQLEDDYKTVLATGAGQRLLRHVVGHCGIYNQSFTGNSETFFREGKRSIGLKVLNEIELFAPEHFANFLTSYANNK